MIIVAGETGSGKTTQLPKICLELGRGVAGQIGHTQPRRIAARTVAERIAEELGTEVGTAVGYKVRFTDKSSDSTLIKVMTDGILLAEMQRDRRLQRYDTLIIDEAHERSLNIDFILGYLKRLLPSRARPQGDRHLGDDRHGAVLRPLRGAPVIEVSGRIYPVEVRYRPLADPTARRTRRRTRSQAIVDAVRELRRGPRRRPGVPQRRAGDPGHRRRARRQPSLPAPRGPAAVRAAVGGRTAPGVPAARRSRVVLATNVAETSLTVPGIRYVVDPGTARISRYSQRTKVQRLPIEPVSSASADQRKGRCGRTSDGICIRLYSEEDFESRPEFTEPEILRTNLASVILQMAALDLGDIADFPFVDPPDSPQHQRRRPAAGRARRVAPGRAARARDPAHRHRAQAGPAAGRPRSGRMILAAGHKGCVREVLIITAALSIQDPRERPADAREAADAHARALRRAGFGLPRPASTCGTT